jgi:hypothetical protein
VRIPTFSRQTDTTTATRDDSATVTGTRAVPVQTRSGQSTVAPPTADRIQTVRPESAATTYRASADRAETAAHAERTSTERAADRATDRANDRTTDRSTDREPTAPVVAGPRPRASLLATLGLITGVASALLVLSGPLAGYGIGLAAVALILSLGGIFATRRRHVAGKSDALIGMVLALGAIVVGVLALTGSLAWLGTDTEPVTRVREWLDAQFIERI